MSKQIEWWKQYCAATNLLTKQDIEVLREYSEDEFNNIFTCTTDKNLMRIVLHTNKLTLHEGIEMIRKKEETGNWIPPVRPSTSAGYPSEDSPAVEGGELTNWGELLGMRRRKGESDDMLRGRLVDFLKGSTIADCPFCGAEASVTEEEFGDSATKSFRVECQAGHKLDCWDDTPEEAIRTWGQRVSV